MIYFRKGQTETFVVTLSEKKTLAGANYLFVFESALKEKVAFVLKGTDDQSQYKTRYNLFSITVDDHFTSTISMMWTYKVYEQESEINLDETGLACLESGYMQLKAAGTYTVPTYSQSNPTIKAFDAE